ncbi:hypothetical protein LCGC14_0396980 [marine sediment metagenome]|uniref:Uncharacterized protein n=1 Tax=marine sediment metagenome TaxID=412755 RepID=A0A0F9SXV2_9ZZZZ
MSDYRHLHTNPARDHYHPAEGFVGLGIAIGIWAFVMVLAFYVGLGDPGHDTKVIHEFLAPDIAYRAGELIARLAG